MTTASKMPALTLKRTGTGTQTFESLKLRGFGWTDKELHYGTPGAAGTLQNIDNNRIAQAEVAVEFYDENTQLGTNTSWLDFLAPSEYGTIEIPYTGDDPSRITRIVARANAQMDTIVPLNSGEIAFSSIKRTTNSYGWPVLNGVLSNETGASLSRIVVFASFYEGEKLLGQGRDSVTNLQPNERAEWSATSDQPDPEKITRHTVHATVRE